MSKKNRNKKKLKKLIEQRLKETQSPLNQNQPSKPIHQEPKPELKIAESQIEKKTAEKTSLEPEPKKESISEAESHHLKPDLKRLGIVLLIIAIFLIGVYFLNTKTTILNNIGQKLFDLFQKS